MALTQVQPGMLGTPQPYNFKNRIINGAMVINQRGFSGTPGSDEYTLDRWFSGRSQASKYTVSQNAGSVTPPTGFINYLGVTSSSAYSVLAGDFFGQAQRIEGLNCSDLDFGKSTAKSITISFWVYSSLTGSFGASISNSAGNRFYPFSYTISSANTWTQASVTIAGDTTGTWLTTNGVGMMLWFSLGMGSNFSGTANAWTSSAIYQPTGSVSVVGTNGATFYITGVQLEVGVSATSFDYRAYGTELALCQRYYQKYTQPPLRGVMNTANTAGRFGMILPVVMRSTPTPTVGQLPLFDGFGTGNVSSISVDYSNTTTVEYDFLCTSSWSLAGRVGLVYQNGSTSLQLSAEL